MRLKTDADLGPEAAVSVGQIEALVIEALATDGLAEASVIEVLTTEGLIEASVTEASVTGASTIEAS